MNTELITKEVLFDHFNGVATALQRQWIDEWVKKTPENEEFFYKCLAEWETGRPQYRVDVDCAVGRFRQQIATTVVSEEEDAPVIVRSFRWVWYAAACLLVLMSTGWFFRSTITNKTYATRPGEIKNWTLEDGSRVTLNSNSTLVVPRFGFGNGSREVHLTGEAEFIVTHQKDNARFIVKTDNALDVTVLGTEFTVYTRNHKTQVVLNKGKVQVGKSGVKELITMTPGDIVRVDEQGAIQHKKLEQTEPFTAWKNHRFVFTETTLNEVAQVLKDNYSLEVEIVDPELGELTVSGSFKAMDAQELAESVAKVLNIRQDSLHDKVIFSSF